MNSAFHSSLIGSFNVACSISFNAELKLSAPVWIIIHELHQASHGATRPRRSPPVFIIKRLFRRWNQRNQVNLTTTTKCPLRHTQGVNEPYLNICKVFIHLDAICSDVVYNIFFFLQWSFFCIFTLGLLFVHWGRTVIILLVESKWVMRTTSFPEPVTAPCVAFPHWSEVCCRPLQEKRGTFYQFPSMFFQTLL